MCHPKTNAWSKRMWFAWMIKKWEIARTWITLASITLPWNLKLKKQFKDFYDEICIHEESEDLKEKRDILQKDIKDKFPDEMKKHDIELSIL